MLVMVVVIPALKKGKVIFSTLTKGANGFSTTDLKRSLEFNSGENIRFYLVRNSTTDAVLSGRTSTGDVVFSDRFCQ
jgi:hypothetical protein